MRVLQAHNYYQQSGGEDAVVAAERALLVDHGHAVRLWSVTNDAIDGAWARARAAWRAPYARAARKKMGEVITDFAPDMAHVHNFFPLLTPSIYDACQAKGIPVVQTLHNYRPTCAATTLARDGRPCEDCVGGSPYQAVVHRCYRNSTPGSLAVARMIDVHRRRGTWRDKVDRFIALTAFAKAKFIEAGFPEDKIAVKPNFAEVRRTQAADAATRRGALFVGRLSPEKGIATLLTAWSSLHVPLRIIGDGPLRDTMEDSNAPEILCVGRQPPEEVAAEMDRAALLVMPSECYENFPIALAEAFRQGLPVIASRLGAMAEIVEDGATGLHFTPGDARDLAAKVRWAVDHPDAMRRMGLNARRVYEDRYTPEANYPQLMAIYREAIKENRRGRPIGPAWSTR